MCCEQEGFCLKKKTKKPLSSLAQKKKNGVEKIATRPEKIGTNQITDVASLVSIHVAREANNPPELH